MPEARSGGAGQPEAPTAATSGAAGQRPLTLLHPSAIFTLAGRSTLTEPRRTLMDYVKLPPVPSGLLDDVPAEDTARVERDRHLHGFTLQA